MSHISSGRIVSQNLLGIIENRILQEYPDFLQQDLSVIIDSMCQLGLMPQQIIMQLDKQAKLTFFNVEQSMRLAECISNYIKTNEKEFVLY